MRKFLALAIVLAFVFGMAGTAFAGPELEIGEVENSTDVYQKIKDVNLNAVVKKDKIYTGYNNIQQSANAGRVQVNNNDQKNKVKNYGAIQANFGDQSNKIVAKGGANQNSGNNTIKEIIKQKIKDKDVNKSAFDDLEIALSQAQAQ